MSWAGERAPTAAEVADADRRRASLRRTLARCGPLLGLPDSEHPPLYLRAAAAAQRRLWRDRRDA
jgi:hypothetical protein